MMESKFVKASWFKYFPIVLAVMLFAGCGGGGGGTGGTSGSTGGTTTVPSAPGALSATASNSQVTINWNPVSGATSYNLYWSTTSGVTKANGTKIAYVASPYTQTGLTNGAPYYYVLTAANSVGESAESPQASATPAAASSSGYTIGGAVVGLATGKNVVLQNNGTDNLTVIANGSFTFSSSLASFSNYNVTVFTQPANGQTCVIVNNNKNMGASSSTGSGTVVTANVDTVRVSCSSVSTFAGSGVYGYGNATGEEATFYGPSGAAVDSVGNLYIADTFSNVIRKITSTGVVTTLAGSGKIGYADGAGTAAQFHLPTAGSGVGTGIAGVAVDGSGNVYVGDTLNNVIRKITSAGVVSTLAGTGMPGYNDATGTAAQFNAPQGVAVDGSGNVYVADTNNYVIRKITSAGVVTTLAGSVGVLGYTNATGTAAKFSWPQGVAVDSFGNVYVADTNNYAIRKITSSGVVTTIAGTGSSGYFDATGTSAQFASPQGITVDAGGNIYVTDISSVNVVRMITPAGVVSTLAGKSIFGYSDGPITTARFYYPMGIAVDSAGNVFVSDYSARRVRKISAKPYSYTVSGHVVGLVNGASLVLQNNGGDNLTINANGLFIFATPLTDVSGATSYNVTISTQPAGQTCAVANATGGFTTGDVLAVNVNCAAVSTLAGSGIAGFTNATGAAAQFNISSNVNSPTAAGVATDAAGNVYVADTYNNVIRKITPGGVVSTFAGSGTAGYVDATGTAAQFFYPRGIAFDSTTGNFYVADSRNNMIRKITSGGVVSTLAGSVTPGYVDATGTAAQFYFPIGVAVDGSGNVYVGDYNNNMVRKITSGGVVTTLAGSQSNGYTNDTGTAARFNSPFGVAVDSTGNVYVADSGNQAIRKITSAGVVTTFAGSPEGYQNNGYLDSTGTGAMFNVPSGVAVDALGTVYVADANNSEIRMINPSGTVTTLAGPATIATGFTNGNGAAALFNVPAGITVDAARNVYVADCFNNVIRKIVQ